MIVGQTISNLFYDTVCDFVQFNYYCVIMAAEGKAIIFYRCYLLFFYFVSIDERPAT